MKRFSLFLFLSLSANCFSQKSNWLTDHQIGGQLGYYYSKINTIDAGLNYYWSINPSPGNNRKNNWNTHTFGPFACADLNFIHGTCYVGERFGFNYHYRSMVSFNICPAIEHIAKNDFRLGTDVGVSVFGFLLYYGYYSPIGSEKMEGISAHRIGIRIVFNMATLNTTPYM